MHHKAVFGAIVCFICVAQTVGIADCSGGIHKGHMLQNITYTGSYLDGEGTYVRCDNVSHPYVFPLIRQCWWEYLHFKAKSSTRFGSKLTDIYEYLFPFFCSPIGHCYHTLTLSFR